MKFTFEEFNKYMQVIESRLHWEEKMHNVVYECPDRSCTIYIPSMIDHVINLLAYILNDKFEFIFQWVYELDCGTRYKDGSITDSDGNNIKLATISDLWAALQPTQ